MTNAACQIHSDQIRCSLSALGASIVSVQVKDKNGQWIDVAMSPKNFQTGDPDPSLAGRTIAPCCGRVRDGKIVINEKEYQLALNDGLNHIHGGPHGAAWQVWREEVISKSTCRFSLTLPDGLDGYPGNRTLTAEYQVISNALQVRYSAVTDQATWIDMTNHVYWDLSGRFDGTALEQTLEIAADQVAINDEHHLITALVPVKDAFDFSTPNIPATLISSFSGDQQISIAHGYNHAYALKKKRSYAARLFSRESGIRMTMYTDQPAIVFYSGGFLGKSTKLKGSFASPGCALALEAQAIPDPFHVGVESPLVLFPDQTHKREIRWEFKA
ncbi:MAG: galactose mutarotase [Clostridia bacterium]|nr:galactose mutarotase [Clostridia bacterium]